MDIFTYTEAVKEHIRCNLCGRDNTKLLSNKGSEGLSINTVLCTHCGLIYINPRMTKEWYGAYYQNEYRNKTINKDKAKNQYDIENLFKKSKLHGIALAELVSRLKCEYAGKWVEIGSSVGGVLAGFKERLNVEVLGIEPSKDEARFAEKQGIKTIASLIEDVDINEKNLGNFDGVICTQSLNHFLNPHYFFQWAYNFLKPGGLLVLEVMNFRHQLERAGHFSNAVQIDHVYMFTPETVKKFVIASGFNILFFEVDRDKAKNINFNKHMPSVHIRVLAEKTKRKPFEDISVLNIRSPHSVFYWNKYFIYLNYLIKYRLPAFFSR